MKLGIGLPSTLFGADRRLTLDWARLADQAGFHVLGTIDKPNYDSWDPLATLAAAAAVTERIRLATTILQLPNRNEVLVAKQAAVIDILSEGRLDLGLAVGASEDDYEVCGMDFHDRGRRFPRQVERIREVWAEAREASRGEGRLGPAPLQELGPPLWLGGSNEKTIERAVQLADGFVFGTAGPERMAKLAPQIRADAAARGKDDYQVIGLAYVGVGDDRAKALEEATHHVLRYYGQLWRAPEELIHHGPADAIAEDVARYEDANLDALILFPQIPDLGQVEALAEAVLPAYR